MLRLHKIPLAYIRQEHCRANRPQTTGVYLEEVDREGIAATATYDATVAALLPERDVRAREANVAYVADTLSRVHIEGQPSCVAPDDMEVPVHSLVENLPATAAKLEQFRRIITADPVMQRLRRFIKHGWPQRKSAVPPEIQPYSDIRDELHEADWLLLLGDRLVVPALLRQSMLQVIHEGHLGGDKCKSRARTSLYWPRMCYDIKETVARCPTCLKYRAKNPKEPLIQHSVPGLRWQKTRRPEDSVCMSIWFIPVQSNTAGRFERPGNVPTSNGELHGQLELAASASFLRRPDRILADPRRT